MTRIKLEVVCRTWNDASAAADELRLAGYDVLIADDIVDDDSEATFAEVYTTVSDQVGRDYADYCASLCKPLVGDEDQVERDFADYSASGRAKPPVPAVDAFWKDVERIINPIDGFADSCGVVKDDHVPFQAYRRAPGDETARAN